MTRGRGPRRRSPRGNRESCRCGHRERAFDDIALKSPTADRDVVVEPLGDPVVAVRGEAERRIDSIEDGPIDLIGSDIVALEGSEDAGDRRGHLKLGVGLRHWRSMTGSWPREPPGAVA